MRTEHYSLKVLRRGIISLTCGRIVSSALTFGAMILVARGLDLQSFGVYTILLAALGLAITYTGLGLDWFTARYVPEYRVHGSAGDLRRLIAGYMGVKVASLALFGAAMYGFMGLEIAWFGLEHHEGAFAAYIAVILMEAFVRSIRGEVFDPLLLQGHSQANAALRGIVFAVLVIVWMQDGLVLDEVVLAEIIASALSLAVAFVQWALIARRLEDHGRSDGWQPAKYRDMFAVAGHNYLAQMISSLASANTLMLLGAAMIGPAAMAGFGFCRTLSEQVRRYLPITMFAGVARPTIVAAYSVDGRFDRLLDNLQFLYKANLLVLLPMVVLTVAYGGDLLSLLSGGKFTDGGLVAAGFMVFLVAQSHRVVLSLLTNIVDRPELTTTGSIASIVALPLGAVALHLGWGPEGLVGAMLAGEIISHLVIIGVLARRGYPYRVDASAYLRLLACTLLTLVATLTVLPAMTTPLTQALALGAPLALFAVLAMVFWPFTAFEREALQRLIGRRRGTPQQAS